MADKKKAKIDWKPAPIYHGSPLDKTHLNATATHQGKSVPGKITYSHAHGTVLPVGRHSVQAKFEPDDHANYDVVEETIEMEVYRAKPIIQWNDPAPIEYGAKLGDAGELNATATYNYKTVDGQFDYYPSAGAALGAGTHKLSVTFTPQDTGIYETVYKTVQIEVTRKRLDVVADDQTKDYGDPVPTYTVTYSEFVLGEDKSVLGGTLTFLTTPDATDASPIGQYTIMPAGLTSQNYAIYFIPGTLDIIRAQLTVTADPQTKYFGDPLPPFTATFNPKPKPAFSGPPTFTSTASASSPPGKYTIAPGGLSSPNYIITFVPGNLMVMPAVVSGKVTFGGQPLAGLEIKASYLPTPAAPLPAGDNGTTVADGTFKLNLMAGQYVRVDFPESFEFRDQRFKNEKLTVFLRGTKSVFLQTLRGIAPAALDAVYELRGCRISGQVQRQAADRSSHVPFPNVQVVLRGDDGKLITQTPTDDTGGFCLFADTKGKVRLEFPREITDGGNLLSIPSNNESSFEIVLSEGLPHPLPAPVIYGLESAEIVGQVSDGTRRLQGIPVSLNYIDGTPFQRQPVVSDKNGIFSFSNLPPGKVELTYPNLVKDPHGKSWELQTGQPSTQVFTLTAGQLQQAKPVAYQTEQHVIEQLVTAGGAPAMNVLVEVRLPGGHYALQAQRTGRDGKATFILADPGDYDVHVFSDLSAQGAPQVRKVTVHSKFVAPPVDLPGRAMGPLPPVGGNGSGDLQSYPVLTEEVPQGGMQRPSTTGTSGRSQLGQTADNAIREVLSWRTKSNDPKGFVTALTQAFALQEVEGHTEWTWTPRSYTVQTDLGAVTGAQASIYARAKVALDQALPLLDGLYTLLPTVLQEDLDSIRQVVRSQFTALVNELGVVGGPRVPRVDQLFLLLLGNPGVTDPEALTSGTLFILRSRFGLKRQFVTTIEDEQNLTNYLILVDYILGLNQSWLNEKGFFSRNGGTREPFFGTQLVLLSRALDVVAQSVRDCYFTMDSVFLGDAERQTTSLDFSDVTLLAPLPGETVPFTFDHGTSSLFVAELLDWVDRASSEELPALLQDAGKDGIPSLGSVVDNLRHFVRGAIIPPQASPSIPPGYRTPRVQRALQELADQLDETFTLASKIKAPQFPTFSNGNNSGGAG
jgi:hypothetical protein